MKLWSISQKKKVLVVRYEDLMLKPGVIVNKAASFLGKAVSPDIKKVLKREHLPNLSYFDKKEEKIMEIKRLSSPKYFKLLMSIQNKYFSE